MNGGGAGKLDDTVEKRILAQDKQARNPELNPDELQAVQAAEVAGGDWGPVFIYGQMLSQQAWCALIGRVPEMRPCWLKDYERREIRCSTFAALVHRPDDETLVVGQSCFGLMPWERRLLDKAVDDGFQLIETVVNPLDEPDVNIEVSTYVWREEKFPEAVGENDWNQEKFNKEWESQFTLMCADLRGFTNAEKMSDETLKEMALRRARADDGFGGDDEWQEGQEEPSGATSVKSDALQSDA